MKKLTYVLLVACLVIGATTACGQKSNDGDTIKKIEVGDTAESKTSAEVKYKEDTAPVVAPDRNGNNDNLSTDENNAIVSEEHVEYREPSIYGIWISDDWSNLTIYNSPDGVKLDWYDASTDKYISGNAETDNTSYINVTYQKPVEVDEDAEAVQYDSEEELQAALEAEQENSQETIEFKIASNSFDSETSTMWLTLQSADKTLEWHAEITTSTPDYSLEDNELAQDRLGGSEEDTKKEVEQ